MKSRFMYVQYTYDLRIKKMKQLDFIDIETACMTQWDPQFNFNKVKIYNSCISNEFRHYLECNFDTTRNDMTYDQCLIEFDCDNK